MAANHRLRLSAWRRKGEARGARGGLTRRAGTDGWAERHATGPHARISAKETVSCEISVGVAAFLRDSWRMSDAMEPELNVPKGLKRKRVLMLPVLLGMTALLYVLLFMPAKEPADSGTPPTDAPKTEAPAASN
jgi:hypothetical protein